MNSAEKEAKQITSTLLDTCNLFVLHVDCEDRGKTLVRNVGQFLLDYKNTFQKILSLIATPVRSSNFK
jgi:hypothetical protein